MKSPILSEDEASTREDLSQQSHTRILNVTQAYHELVAAPVHDLGKNRNRGVKHWDKRKFRTALEWVVFTSSRTARLELTKVLDAGKNWK